MLSFVASCSEEDNTQVEPDVEPDTQVSVESEKASDPNGYVDLDRFEMVWQDEFDYPDIMLENEWTVVNYSDVSNSDMLCSRWRENAVVEDGVIRLYMLKEEREGKSWTAASLYTKSTYQYGYYECRYKYAGAKSTNNSFWLMQASGTPIADDGVKIEIDINEGHYPNVVNLNIHNWSADSSSSDYVDPSYHAFGNSKEVEINIDNAIKSSKLRFSSSNGPKFHLKEFRAYSVNGTTNYMLESGVSFSCSGIYSDNSSTYGPAKIADNNENTGWVTQEDGSKWVEIDLGAEREIGSIDFITGYSLSTSVTPWVKTVSDYTVEYLSGDEWVEIESWDASDEYDFSGEYHTCGLEWTADELIFYFDGEEIRRQTNVFCNSPVNVYLSLALLDSVGDPTDEDSGKYMEVDYVRVYAEK